MPQTLRYATPLLMLATLLACGEGASTNEINLPTLASRGIEITGTLAQAGAHPALLVFALVEAPADSGAAEQEQPPSVAVVNEQGEFVLSGVAPGTVSVVFLDDRASDGVIDDGDPIAVLAHEGLRNLQDGNRVNLVNVRLDFRTQQAVAERVDVGPTDPAAPTAAPAPTATPTP